MNPVDQMGAMSGVSAGVLSSLSYTAIAGLVTVVVIVLLGTGMLAALLLSALSNIIAVKSEREMRARIAVHGAFWCLSAVLLLDLALAGVVLIGGTSSKSWPSAEAVEQLLTMLMYVLWTALFVGSFLFVLVVRANMPKRKQVCQTEEPK